MLQAAIPSLAGAASRWLVVTTSSTTKRQIRPAPPHSSGLGVQQPPLLIFVLGLASRPSESLDTPSITTIHQHDQRLKYLMIQHQDRHARSQGSQLPMDAVQNMHHLQNLDVVAAEQQPHSSRRDTLWTADLIFWCYIYGVLASRLNC